jgi:hypothetical protein
MDEKPTTARPQAKPRRRWYQYTLRTLLIVVTLAGCGLGWLGFKVRQSHRRQAAVEAIKRSGGRVAYDYERVKNAKAPGPDWLRRLLGEDFFSSVSVVVLHGSDITKAALIPLDDLPDVQLLDLTYSNVGDGGLEHIKGLSQLHGLSLAASNISDAGMVHLMALNELQYLDLRATSISDAGVERLKGLSQLTKLFLAQTRVGDAGLPYLKGLTRLQILNLWETNVTAAGVKDLQASLPNCKIDLAMPQ